MAITEFEKSSRAKRGLLLLRELKSNPHRLVGFRRIKSQSDQFIIATENEKHVIVSPKDYRRSDRYSNGSYAFDQHELGNAVSMRQTIDTTNLE